MRLLHKLSRTVASLAFVTALLHTRYALVGSDKGARHDESMHSFSPFLQIKPWLPVLFCWYARIHNLYCRRTIFAIHSTANMMHGRLPSTTAWIIGVVRLALIRNRHYVYQL